jgi:hypothetical protein
MGTVLQDTPLFNQIKFGQNEVIYDMVIKLPMRGWVVGFIPMKHTKLKKTVRIVWLGGCGCGSGDRIMFSSYLLELFSYLEWCK